jgi:hypothetical protein
VTTDITVQCVQGVHTAVQLLHALFAAAHSAMSLARRDAHRDAAMKSWCVTPKVGKQNSHHRAETLPCKAGVCLLGGESGGREGHSAGHNVAWLLNAVNARYAALKSASPLVLNRLSCL